jgi:hypothetical protein
VNAGGANAHEFNLSGVAHFRVAIPPEATEADADIDVYVFDPTGTLVAQSTLGDVGTVDVSWTGATTGQWHLGAVSHNRGSEMLGLTLVEVDNR